MATITMRRATAYDCVELYRLGRKVMEEQGQHIWYPKVTQDAAKGIANILSLIDSGIVFVAALKETGQIVGVIGMVINQDRWSDAWRLTNEWFYVIPEYRDRTDIANNLLRLVEEFADSNTNPRTGEPEPLAIMMGLYTGIDMEVKNSWFERKGYQNGGGNFVRGPNHGFKENEEHFQDADTRVA